MTYGLPKDAPEDVVEQVERLNEFAINQLGVTSQDAMITAKKNTTGVGPLWIIEMEMFPNVSK